MKTLLVIISLIVSLNVSAGDYINQYKNAPNDTYIVHKAHARITQLRRELFELSSMMQHNKATDKQKAIYKERKSEYDHLISKYGTPVK